MKWQNNSSSYGAVPISLHWLTVILIVIAYAAMELKGFANRGTPLRESMAIWHYTAGLSVLILTALRVLVNFAGSKPNILPAPPALQHKVAQLVKILLYAFMICMPLLGWLTLSAKGHDVSYFDWTFPALMAPDKAWGELFKEVHETIATMAYFLIGLHALAALWHHYIRRDNTLRMMWFNRK